MAKMALTPTHASWESWEPRAWWLLAKAAIPPMARAAGRMVAIRVPEAPLMALEMVSLSSGMLSSRNIHWTTTIAARVVSSVSWLKREAIQWIACSPTSHVPYSVSSFQSARAPPYSS